jgi:hypothetical protein
MTSSLSCILLPAHTSGMDFSGMDFEIAYMSCHLDPSARAQRVQRDVRRERCASSSNLQANITKRPSKGTRGMIIPHQNKPESVWFRRGIL